MMAGHTGTWRVAITDESTDENTDENTDDNTDENTGENTDEKILQQIPCSKHMIPHSMVRTLASAVS